MLVSRSGICPGRDRGLDIVTFTIDITTTTALVSLIKAVLILFTMEKHDSSQIRNAFRESVGCGE
jgi:hypothetical protein